MSRPIRVLSVIGELLMGGGEHRLLSFARSIDRSRFEHTIVALSRSNLGHEERATMPKLYADAGIHIEEFDRYRASETSKKSFGAKALSLAHSVRGLTRIIKARRIDVIDAHMETAAITATVAGLVTNRPLCVTLYHVEPLVKPSFWGVARQFMFARANLIITDSALRGREILDAALLRRPSIAIVPNGVWTPLPVRDLQEMKTRLKIPPGPGTTVIGQVSAFLEFKGHMVLLEAAREVLRERPDTYFLLVGYTSHDEDFRLRIEQRAVELGITDHVRILNYPGPIGDIWQVIDIHVHASLFDSLPNAILEGMSLSKPAVVTAVGGVPAAVIDGKTGLVVPPGKAATLANGLLTLLRNPELAQEFGRAAFLQYQKGYRPELTARKLEFCLETMVERS